MHNYSKLFLLMHMEVYVRITAEEARPSMAGIETDPFIASFCSHTHGESTVISNDGIGKHFSN